jgi:hypothetical protein
MRYAPILGAIMIVVTVGLTACEEAEKGPLETLGKAADEAASDVKDAANEAANDLKRAAEDAKD